MKICARYFTPEYSNANRIELFRALGLEKLRYNYVETFGEDVVRIVTVEGLKRVSRIIPLKEISDASLQQPPIPYVVVRHPPNKMSLLQAPISRSIWADLFPFPFSTMSWLFDNLAASSEMRVEVFPVVFRDALQCLWAAISEMERKMGCFEVNVLQVQAEFGLLLVVLQYVQKRRVRMGTLRTGDALFEGSALGVNSPSDWKQAFGIKPQTLFMDSRDLEGSNSIQLILNLAAKFMSMRIEAPTTKT